MNTLTLILYISEDEEMQNCNYIKNEHAILSLGKDPLRFAHTGDMNEHQIILVIVEVRKLFTGGLIFLKEHQLWLDKKPSPFSKSERAG